MSAITPAAPVIGAVDVTLEAADGSVTAVEGFTYEPSSVTVFVRGDVDASGTFGIEDAIQLLEVLFKNRDIPCLDVVDVDDNGELTLLDGLHLLEYIFLGGPPPAAPFPLAGPDPTPGAPGCERSP